MMYISVSELVITGQVEAPEEETRGTQLDAMHQPDGQTLQWKPFLLQDERVVYSGLVAKRRSFSHFHRGIRQHSTSLKSIISKLNAAG